MIKVQSVVPQIDKSNLLAVMRQVFKQYDFCKRLPRNTERDQYISAIESAVHQLPDKEREVVTQRYMIDLYRKDYQVYNFILDPPVSKDTYSKIRNRAFIKLFIILSDRGILQSKEGERT
ncbi:hypothetical protein [Peribacillus sp. NPDC056705]|uniref:hypothetical protein n=1 Tax=Peribacillus sp. NPDC056705 TaxID=3345918 RepID=UPI0037492FB3